VWRAARLNARTVSPRDLVRNPTNGPQTKKRRRSGPKSQRSRYGRFFVDTTLSGYENAIGECRACGAHLTVNRATDLGDTYPSAHKKFRCFACGKLLQLGGDIANHPVDQIAYDAYEPLLRRQYTRAMLMIAQSLEWALAMCVYHVVLGRLRRPRRLRPDSPFNRVLAQLDDQMDHLTLGSLRTVVAGLGIAGCAPRDVERALETVAMLRKLKRAEPKLSDVVAIADAKLRDAINLLVAAKPFVKLRNQIVHHGARPTQAIAEHYYEEIPKLATRLLRGFGVMTGQLVMPPTAGGRRRAG
jgi:hypothetical protein